MQTLVKIYYEVKFGLACQSSGLHVYCTCCNLRSSLPEGQGNLFYFHLTMCILSLQNLKPKSPEGQITTSITENSNDKPKAPPKKSISMTSVVSSAEICRICHCEAEPDQPLISPCLCAGSLQYVHQSCLQRWIKSSDTKKCELCKYEFRMESKMKPITKVSCWVHKFKKRTIWLEDNIHVHCTLIHCKPLYAGIHIWQFLHSMLWNVALMWET